MPEIKLIVGLGNPGKKYANTRHNIGFQAIDFLADRWDVRWKNWDSIAEVAGGSGTPAMLLKPQGYMNNSGMAVKAASSYYHITPDEVLVLVDDFSLPLGAVRARLAGSAGGHNGLSSIIEHLGTDGFPRVRMGIGPLPVHVSSPDFVLSNFAAAEQEAVQNMARETTAFIERVYADGWEKAVSKLPGRGNAGQQDQA